MNPETCLFVNGDARYVRSLNLAELLEELGYQEQEVATSVGNIFIAREHRRQVGLNQGMQIDIVAPMQGG